MRDNGIVYRNGSKYVFDLEESEIKLYPCNPYDDKGFYGIHENEKYRLELIGNPGVRGFVWRHSALVSSTNMLQHGAYLLKAEYVFSRWDGNGNISGLEIYGESIDDLMAFINTENDLFDGDHHLHSRKETVFSSWDMTFRGKRVSVQMLLANVQNYKGRSTYDFHPVFRVCVQEDDNIDTLYTIYRSLMNAVRIMRFRFPTGEISVKLWDLKDTPRKIGVMIDGAPDKVSFSRRYSIAPLQFWEPYMKRLLQFCMNDDNLQLEWFPYETQRFCPEDYDPHCFSHLFTAFEHECHREPEIYESVSTDSIDDIKSVILADLENIKGQTKNEEELRFVEKTITTVAKLDTQIGQKKKLLRAYGYVCEGISDLLPIIYSSEGKSYKGEEMRSRIPALRGRIVHEGGNYHFSDLDAGAAKILELIVYAQMLRRAGMKIDEIKKIIEFVFEHAGGNYTFVAPDE